MVTQRRVKSNGVSSVNSIGTEYAAAGKKEHGVPTVINYKVDDSGVKEFGGVLGTLAAMVFFPLLMWYLWIGHFYYDAQLPWPDRGEPLKHFWWKLVGYVIEVCKDATRPSLANYRTIQGAYPTRKAWIIYWGFLIWQSVLYVTLPGVWAKGSPIPHLNNQRLDYYCNGVWALYTTLAIVAILHVTGIFPLYTVLDEFGPLLTVSIISGIAVSFFAYFSAIWRGAEHRMTGSFIYDFFMGAELHPRMGLLDLKMFCEIRLPWYILLLISCAAATRQYEKYGYVTSQVMFKVMVHWLYANACAKGEELVGTTW